MSAENSVARGGRDVDVQAEPAGFQIPPELATHYQVRVIEPAGGGERRVGMFLPRDRENPSIEIAGDRIVARNEDPETVQALVKIAQHNGWEGIDVEGSPEFRKAVWTAATRVGLTVHGYEPSFAEQERMEELRREDARHRDREGPQEPGPRPVVDAAIPARSAPAERGQAALDPSAPGSGTPLSNADQRLLLTLSAHAQDRKALYETMRPDMAPLEREFQQERIDLNRDDLNGAIEKALESPTLAKAFVKSGYEPDDLRRIARDADIAEAIQLVRSGLNRHDIARNTTVTGADELAADREDRLVAESIRAPEREAATEPRITREERQRDDAGEREHEREELAELFLHGGAERIAGDPRLADAAEVQARMEQHLGEVFEGDPAQVTAANLESRQMISDALRRGLDVSIREPTPVRQIEPIPLTPDLER